VLGSALPPAIADPTRYVDRQWLVQYSSDSAIGDGFLVQLGREFPKMNVDRLFDHASDHSRHRYERCAFENSPQ